MGRKDHEQQCGNADGNAGEHPWGKDFVEHQGAYEDGCNWLKHTKYCGAGRANYPCRKSQGEHGDHGRENGKADEVNNRSGRVAALQERSLFRNAGKQEKNAARCQCIEGEGVLGDVPDALRAVNDNQVQSIAEGGESGQDHAAGVQGYISLRKAQEHDTKSSCSN